MHRTRSITQKRLLRWSLLCGITLSVFCVGYVSIRVPYVYFVTYNPQNLMTSDWNSRDRNVTSFPRILHHTWKDEVVPRAWKATYQSCLRVHKDYMQMFWTDADLDEFIEKEYPWFLETYRSYPYNIQRSDAARYFLLYHYGGFYIDLDAGCRSPPIHKIMSEFPGCNVLLVASDPTGVTNSYMASTRGHALFKNAIEHLEESNRWFLLPYITVMMSTGPMFLTGRLSEVLPHDVYILSEYDKRKHFRDVKGNSWHRWDSRGILYIGSHLRSTFLACFFFTVSIFAVSILLGRYFHHRQKKLNGVSTQ